MELIAREQETDGRVWLMITSGSLFVLCSYVAMFFSGADFSEPLLIISVVAIVACVFAGMGMSLRAYADRLM